ncbi:MAG: hypothetical protein Q9159_001666 [Coniocarpon cinnabarinum]
MGGSLFTTSKGSAPALFCPRLDTPIYDALKSRIATILEGHFHHVSTPYEAPEKTTHGDIDFVLAEPKRTDQPFSPDHILQLTNQLSAVRAESRGKGEWSFAVPVPEITVLGSDCEITHAFAQVDLGLCHTEERFHWQMLTHSYGDLFQILGVLMRPLGLTFVPDGFIARISPRVLAPDPVGGNGDDNGGDNGIHYTHSMASRTLLLSRSPEAVLKFLGLDVEKWQQGFESLDDIYRFVSSSRFFNRRTFEAACEESHDEAAEEQKPIHNVEKGEWTTKQKSRDKRRKRLRPMYRGFVEEWLPSQQSHPDISTSHDREHFTDREALFRRRTAALHDALSFFEKRDEYDRLVTNLNEIQEEATFWTEVRQRIPLTAERLGCAMRGLKSWVGFNIAEMILVKQDGGTSRTLRRPPMILSRPVKKGSKQPTWTKETGLSRGDLLLWVDSNWQTCKKLEREREKRAKEAKCRERGVKRK